VTHCGNLHHSRQRESVAAMLAPQRGELRHPGDCDLAIVYDTYQREASQRLPLLGSADPSRVFARRNGKPVTAAQFLAQVEAVADRLPAGAAAVNLCEDRYAFLVAFCAIVLRGQTNLLPSSRAPQAIDEVMAAHPDCYALGEQALDPAQRRGRTLRDPAGRLLSRSRHVRVVDHRR